MTSITHQRVCISFIKVDLCLVLNEHCTASPIFQGGHFIYITKTVSRTQAIFGPRGFTWMSAG